MNNNKYKVLAIMGKAGSGKDTLLRSVMHYKEKFPIHAVVSYTTRPPREGEKEGKDYHFINTADFWIMENQGKMLESCNFNGWYYGTGLNALDPDKINIGVFNPSGVRALLNSPQVELQIIYLRAADKERFLRQLNRETSPNCYEIARRFLADEEDFAAVEDWPITNLYNDSQADFQISVIETLDIVSNWTKKDNL